MAAAAAASYDEVRRRICVAATALPLTVGAAPFNDAMVRALRRRANVRFLSWRRPYPPLLYRGPVRAERDARDTADVEYLLDWANPATWRRAVAAARAFEAEALVLPWLHPVMAPPYLSVLRAARASLRRVVICHNVLPHESIPLGHALTGAVLRQADVLVTHAPHQEEELRALGVRGEIIRAFHPLFAPESLAPDVARDVSGGERKRLGDPDLLLLLYGAVRPYKGADLAIEALARVDSALDVKLVVAGRFWNGSKELDRLATRLGVRDRVELRDGYVSDADTRMLFEACDAAILPYRSASQSGVVAMAFGHGRPVIATSVGGLPAAVQHGRDGLLVAREDIDALARAIEQLARDRIRLTAGARETSRTRSFDRYAEILLAGLR